MIGGGGAGAAGAGGGGAAGEASGASGAGGGPKRFGLVLSKNYPNEDAIKEDNDSDIPVYFDKKYDTTNYAFIEAYRDQQEQMSEAEFEKTTATIAISTRPDTLTATGEVMKFDGFLKSLTISIVSPTFKDSFIIFLINIVRFLVIHYDKNIFKWNIFFCLQESINR